MLGYPEQQFIDNFEKRIYLNLATYWSAQRNTLTSLKKIKDFLHRMNNTFREQQETKLIKRSDKEKSSSFNNSRRTALFRAY